MSRESFGRSGFFHVDTLDQTESGCRFTEGIVDEYHSRFAAFGHDPDFGERTVRRAMMGKGSDIYIYRRSLARTSPILGQHCFHTTLSYPC
jgi:hypothetical protein